MKYFIFITVLSLLVISCSNDCKNVDCIDPSERPFPGFTIRSASKNLIGSQDIDIQKIKAFNVLGNTNIEIDVLFTSSLKDTFFRVAFEDFHNKVKLNWPGDSIIIDVNYETINTECCGKLTRVIEMKEKGIPLQSPNGIIIIKR